MAKKSVKIKVEEEPAAFARGKAGAPASRGMRGDDEDILPEGIENDPIPKSSCALWSIFLLLFIILLVLIGLLFYLKTKNLSLSKSKTNTASETSELVMYSGDEVTQKFTDEQIASAIKANNANFPIKKASVRTNTEKILISGKNSNSFWGISVEAGVAPKVENGRIKFEITEIKSAGMKAPNSISDVVNNNLGQYLDGLSSSLGDIEVSKVELFDGYILITGTQKS